MKTHFTLWIYILVLLLPIGVAAQDKLKIKDPGGNVLMEVRPEGVLVRKFTTIERLAVAGLTSAENGLMVYDTDTRSLWLWRDTQWIEVDGVDLVDDADHDPTNELQNWMTLPGIPPGFVDGTDNVDDADHDPTNELQNWSTLPGVPAGFADGTDNVDDADHDPANELQSWSTLPGIPAEFADGTDNVNDADSDPLNEKNISLTRNSTQIELTDAGGMLSTNIGWAVDVGKVFNTTDNVGIGTSTPGARLTVQGGAVLISGTIGATPVSGSGTRLMWVPSKQAFRAGTVNATQWDDANIGVRSFVGGGANNVAIGFNSVVAGGNLDSATANNTFVGGGFDNTSSGSEAFVGGGSSNTASGSTSFVGGGLQNKATGFASFVSGRENTSSASHSFVGGGTDNIASGENSIVAGGTLGSAIATGAFVGGGNSNTASGSNSFVGAGLSNTASGYASMASGRQNKASGNHSFVGGGLANISLGENSIVAGGNLDSAIALNAFVSGGFDNTASGINAMAGGGYVNTSSGHDAFIGGGVFNSASGAASFIGGGYQNTSPGSDAFVGGGVTNIASGNTSFVAGGLSNIASGYASFATGRENTASGNHSFAGGTGLLAKSFGETVFGSYNKDYTPASALGYVNTDRLFVIGNGTNTSSRSNAMTVLKGGNVGIGTDDPQAGLHVVGSKGLGEHVMLIENTNHEGSGLKIKISGSHPIYVQGEGDNPDFFITRPVTAIETILEDVGGDIRDYLLSDQGITFDNLNFSQIGSPAGMIDQMGLTEFLSGGFCKGVSSMVDLANNTILQPIQLPNLPLDGLAADLPNMPLIPLIPNVSPFTIDIPNPSITIPVIDQTITIPIPPADFPVTGINAPINTFNSGITNVNTGITNVNSALETGYDYFKSGLTTIDNYVITPPQLVAPTSVGFIDCPNPNPWDNFDIKFERLNPFSYNILDPLGHDNEFISFVDSYDNKLGAIRAENIGEFNIRYFKLSKVLEIGSYVVGLFSPNGSLVKNGLKLLGEAYSYYRATDKMGVEYASGHGDYAEWLERADHTEFLDYGDIVGIRGGKISLALDGAEQVMVVSKAPIVLGNIPDAGNEINGNNIAFIGQVPVKVMGPVTTGDYIVANVATPRYGIAIPENEITSEQLSLAVGRSWESNSKPGFKFVNTIVGMHNNGWATPVIKLQQRIDANDTAIQQLTVRLDNLENNSSVAQVNKRSKL